jgi:hypothetical protein
MKDNLNTLFETVQFLTTHLTCYGLKGDVVFIQDACAIDLKGDGHRSVRITIVAPNAVYFDYIDLDTESEHHRIGTPTMRLLRNHIVATFQWLHYGVHDKQLRAVE